MSQAKLTAYKNKRDFSKTAEPSGDADVAPSERRRFVIQKHAATRLHYDLRIELDGVFKSWAVTKGPSLDPHDKRLAVEVEDHPLEYGDFEGTIPDGEYGGGTVMVWDRGYWEPEGPLSPEEALAKGDFKFTAEGKKLRGSWVLVRMKRNRPGDKRTNWLLIKHRDSFAVEEHGEAILDQDRSVASGRTLEAIAEGRGKAPKPFVRLDVSAPADAVWGHDGVDAGHAKPKAGSKPSGAKTKGAEAAGSPNESSTAKNPTAKTSAQKRSAAKTSTSKRATAKPSTPAKPRAPRKAAAASVVKPPASKRAGREPAGGRT